MGYVGPPHAVAVGHVHGVAEELRLGLGPELVDAVHRQFALGSPARMHEVLEAIHRHLPEDGGDRALEALGEQAQAILGVLAASSIRPNTSASPNTDAVSAMVSGVDW